MKRKANKLPAVSKPTLASWAINARVPATSAIPRPWTALSFVRADGSVRRWRRERSPLAISRRGVPIHELTGDVIFRRRFVSDE